MSVGKVIEILRKALGRRPGAPPAPARSLEVLADEALALVEVMKLRGWEVYQKKQLEDVARWIDRLLALPVDRFTGMEGVELRAKILAGRELANAYVKILQQGMAAEKQLAGKAGQPGQRQG